MDEIKSEGKQVQQDYLEILNNILRKLQEKGEFEEVSSKDISIYVGKDLSYKGSPENKNTINTMSQSAVDKLNTAINNPENLKGSVRIMIGKDKVFHVRDGEVIADKLELIPKKSQELKTEAVPEVQQQATQTSVTEAPEEPITIQQLQKQIDVLQSKIELQQKVIDSFSSQQQKSPEEFQKIVTEFDNLKSAFETQEKSIQRLQKGLEEISKRPTPQFNNVSLKGWIGQVESNVKKSAQGLYEQVKTSLSGKVDAIKSQIKSLVTPKIDKIKAQLETQMESLKGEMQSQMEGLRNELNTSSNVVKSSISEVKELVKNEVQQAMERHQAAVDTVGGKISEEVNTVHKQITQAVSEINSAATNTVKQNLEKVTNSVMETQGKAIANNVDKALRLFGKRNKDGSLSYETSSFKFHKQGNDISITSKADGRPVMVEGNLTSAATQKDIESLDKVETAVNTYLKPTKSQSQSQSKAMKQ